MPGKEARTDLDGVFRLDLPAGTYKLRFNLEDFNETVVDPVVVTVGRTTESTTVLSRKGDISTTVDVTGTVQESWVPFQDAVYDRVGNILMSRVMGAQIDLVDEGFDIGIRESWQRALDDVKARGGKPYAIPAGASVHKYGGLGFVGFAEEVREQEAAMGIRFDYIIVCTVTGSTHAGMLVGFAKDGRARNVIGIDASGTPQQTRAQVLEIAQNTADLVELGQQITADDVILNEDYAYPAYGVPSEETNAAIRLCARMEGMMTDPLYEGKPMLGLIDLVQKDFFPAGSKILYAHLGGVPAINGYSYIYRNG
jgi:1-aminocyclopropane-1-carboxylate deaminase